VVDQKTSKNGTLFLLDQPLLTKYRMGQYIMSNPNLSAFADMMTKVGILEPNFTEAATKNKYPNIKITEAANAFYWTAFVPDNAAMAQAQTDGVCATKADSLNFVNYHLIQKTVFDNGVFSGTVNTLLTGKTLVISNSSGNLRITDASGQQVTVNHSNADHVVRRGVVHVISSYLKSH
jgi:hypothetical protein